MSEPETKQKTVIFDFDGVIVDSFDFHLSNINDFFKVNVSEEEYRDSHNGNFYDNTVESLKGVDFMYRSGMIAGKFSKLPLDTTAENVLKDLADKYVLHIITSAHKPQVSAYLEAHKIKELFSTILYADDGLSKHEKFLRIFKESNIVPGECIFVTDTLGDLKEANKLNIKTIAVTFGFHDRKRLSRENPTYFADSWEDIKKIITN